MLKPIITLLSLSMLSSCAISESNCRAGDWQGLGLRDGANGRSATHVETYQKTCAKYDVTPNVQEWLIGRETGLQTYCTPENSYKIGRRGTNLRPVCEPSIIPSLKAANKKGQRYHAVQSEINALERERRQLQSELSDVPNDATGHARRATILSRISNLDFKLRLLFLDRLRYDSL